MAELGVNVQVLPGGEIFMALDRGALDAAEWIGPYDDEKLGLPRAARFYYYPGWWEPGPNLSFYVNQSAWARLPATYKEIFTAASHQVGQWMLARYDTLNPPALQRLLVEGVKMRPFSEEIMKAARAASAQLLEESAAADAGYRKIYDHWSQARLGAFRWFDTAEAAYARFAFGD
jgi:TRAP-type mannitol/chloroaromatic compound transport system substrate-binding protein